MKTGKVFKEIRRIVAQIPFGSVTTYGTVAKLAGVKDNRMVGWAVWGNQDPAVPCHRVVRKDGSVADRFSLGGWKEQKRRLEAEGIGFVSEKKVDLERHFFGRTKKTASSTENGINLG
jgi:methylated-DNA-protein-cysteine methyltransferase-like protein